MDGRACAACRELEQLDARGPELHEPASEAELGLVLDWPEAEPRNDAV